MQKLGHFKKWIFLTIILALNGLLLYGGCTNKVNNYQPIEITFINSFYAQSQERLFLRLLPNLTAEITTDGMICSAAVSQEDYDGLIKSLNDLDLRLLFEKIGNFSDDHGFFQVEVVTFGNPSYSFTWEGDDPSSFRDLFVRLQKVQFEIMKNKGCRQLITESSIIPVRVLSKPSKPR